MGSWSPSDCSRFLQSVQSRRGLWLALLRVRHMRAVLVGGLGY
ncbi:MAG: hypothetical protein JWN43_1508 [Gammaproteobacteria bacterium]|nr:hypothetical protein [Gammaproteobacteria bacterium]